MPVDPDLLLDLIGEESEVLVASGGVVYQGHIQSAVAGRMVLVGRVAGMPGAVREVPLDLELVSAIGRVETVDEDEDELVALAREQVRAAREWADMPLAERMLRIRLERNQDDGE